MTQIKVDIDELISKLDSMKEDGFVTANLKIDEGDYDSDSELYLSVTDIENDDEISYGKLNNQLDEL